MSRKGYMVYVEGMNKPEVIFREFGQAFGSAHALAIQKPGHEVFVFGLSSRVIADTSGKVTKLPTKVPPADPDPITGKRPKLRLKSLDQKKESGDK